MAKCRQYADEILLFFRASQSAADKINTLLDTYGEEEAGQRINRTKSRLIVSGDTLSNLTSIVKSTLQIRTDSHFVYLGNAIELANHRSDGALLAHP